MLWLRSLTTKWCDLIRLKTLQLQGFRRFTEPTTITFPERGLLLLDGDSGVGKSTILQGIAFALGICPFPSTTLKSWTGEPLQVVLTLEKDGESVVVAKGKKTFVQYGDSPPHTGAKAVDEEIVKIFGMAPDLISALTYRPQDELGVFLSKDDAEKKEFLAKVLGLNNIESAIDEAEERRKKLQSELSFAQGILAEREGGLRKALDGLTEVSPDPVDIGFEQRLQNATNAVATLETQYSQLEVDREAATAAYLSRMADVVAAKTEQLQTAKTLYKKVKGEAAQKNAELETKRDEIRSKITKISVQLGSLPSVKTEIKACRARIQALESNECYVCHRPFTAEAQIDEEREQLKTLEESVAVEPTLVARREALGKELASLVPFVEPKEAKLLEVANKLEFWLTTNRNSITDPVVIDIEQKLRATMALLVKAKDDLSSAKDDFHQFQQACTMKATMRARQETVRQAAAKQVDEARQKVAELEFAVNAEKDFLAVLGKEGFLGAIFGEVLTEISTAANAALAQLGNVSHVSVTFRSENAKGKKTIVPVFFVNGNEATRNSGLSGGMGASADLAVDLGVVDVVQRRLGSTPGWLALDETFNGMPKSTKETALEILENFAQNRLVIVVDHGTEMKEHFTQVLTVKQVDDRVVVE